MSGFSLCFPSIKITFKEAMGMVLGALKQVRQKGLY